MVRAELTANAAYRAQLVLSAFGWVVPLVMLVIWQAATAERADVTAGQITAYFLVILLLTLDQPHGSTGVRLRRTCSFRSDVGVVVAAGSSGVGSAGQVGGPGPQQPGGQLDPDCRYRLALPTPACTSI